MTSHTSTSNQTQITFSDIAIDNNSGITYQRGASERNSIADQIKQQPVFDPANAPLFPMKARGAPGVAVFDYDGDNDLDIYVANGPGAGNSLYENQVSDTNQVSFIDVAAQAGVAATDQDSAGVSYGDIDNDGDVDLLVLGSGEPNQLLENQGDGTFIDITQQSAIGGDTTYSASASMGDINGDGLLDIVIANTFNWDNQLPIVAEPFALNESNQLLLNRGNNVFEDVSDSSGFTNISSLPTGVSTITWAVAMVDYDLDGDMDIIQADDQAAISPTALGGVDRGYIQVFNNDGTGAFTNVTEAANLDLNGFWMGLSFGDFNHDGNLDIFGSNFGDYSSSLIPIPFDPPTSRWFLGQDDGSFVDPGVGNLGATPFGWGTSAFDYDNDSDTDIVFHGGMDFGQVVDASNPGVILKNDGNANFVYDLEAGANSTDHLRRNVQGVAVGDLNGDGFVDIVSVSNFDSPAPIPLVPYPVNSGSELDGIASLVPVFVPGANPNELVWSGIEFPDGTLSVEINSADNHNNWIAVETVGTVGLTAHSQVNRSGIGATVFFTPDGGPTAITPILGGASYGSQDSLTANFGLGEATTGTIEVLWQGGTRNRLYDVQAGEQVVLPEIPVSFDGVFSGSNDYQQQLDQAIMELITADVISEAESQRLFASNVQAYMEENNLGSSLAVGGNVSEQLVGTSSDDYLYGLDGDDTVAGDLGDDTIFGGDGDDILRGDLNQRSTQGNSGGDDSLFGGAGNDRIGGKGGNDRLFGEAGDDLLWGDDGDDLLRGGLGNDTMTGDNASGSQGADTFVLAVGEGQDTITDFEVGTDLLGLADGLTFGQLIFRDSDILAGNEVLATLTQVSSNNLTAADFVSV